MKKVFYFLLLAFAASQNLYAQNSSGNPFNQSDATSNGTTTENVWGNSTPQSNPFSTSSKQPGVPVKPGGTTSAPIDGGVVILLAAGALYGRRKFTNERKAKQASI